MMHLADVTPLPSTTHSTGIVVHQVEDLVVFFEPRIDLAILARELSPALAGYAARFAPGSPWGWTERVEANGFELDGLSRSLPQGDGRDELIHDIRLLVEVIADITGAEHVGVRLIRIVAPMCPRFHVDPVFVRLLVSYAGPGPEWLEERDVERRFLGHGAEGKLDEQSGLLRQGAIVRQIKTGDVGLFKGKGYPGNENRGAVHRSPPQTNSPQPRLLLTLDPLD